MSAISIKDKLQDVLVVTNEFKDDNGDNVKYNRLVVVVEFDGVAEEYEAQFSKQVGKAGYRLVQLADDVV